MKIRYKTIGWILLFILAVIVAVESLKLPMYFYEGAILFIIGSTTIAVTYHKAEINGEIQIPPSKE